MPIRFVKHLVVSFLFFFATSAFAGGELRYAALGDFALESGEVMKEARLAYRTYGTLNADKSNAILFSTWLAGTTQELVDYGYIGPGKLADTDRYFVIAVDAFGNGVSTSPTNSSLQPGGKFPTFVLRDLVRAQHRLVTAELGLKRLAAVVGISMGGMTALEWAVAYPEIPARIAAVASSPRLTSYDLLLWHAQLNILAAAPDTPAGRQAAMKAIAAVTGLHAQTPAQVAAVPPEKFPAYLADLEKNYRRLDGDNWAAQLRAIVRQDIRPSGATMEEAARRVKARVLLVQSAQDWMVNPEPVEAFAKLIWAETRTLPGTCGHFAFLCEKDSLQAAVNRFLEERRAQ